MVTDDHNVLRNAHQMDVDCCLRACVVRVLIKNEIQNKNEPSIPCVDGECCKSNNCNIALSSDIVKRGLHFDIN